jgi:hypothetical protein
MGLEPTIPVLKQANTVHALDRAATVTGQLLIYADDIDTEDYNTCTMEKSTG